MAPINGMCKYIRNMVLHDVKDYDKETVGTPQLKKFVKAINDYHNKKKVIPLYKETPENITRE